MYSLLIKKNITLNNLFVLNLLNEVNLYIFKCERAPKAEKFTATGQNSPMFSVIHQNKDLIDQEY